MNDDNRPVIVVDRAGAKNTATTTTKSLSTRLGTVENIIQAVIWVGIITLVAVVVAVAALVLDQMHFNNQTYRDQSEVRAKYHEELSTKIDLLKQELANQKAPVSPSPQPSAAQQ